MNIRTHLSKRLDPAAQKIGLGALFILILFLFLALLWNQGLPGSVASAQGPTPYGLRGYWDLIFTDDFNSSAIDPNKWIPCYWWANSGCTNEGSPELQWYLPRNLAISNGSLFLVPRQETVNATDGKVYRYTSGMLTTDRDVSNISIPPRFVYKYGYVEVRARVPKGSGLWPAITLLPADHSSKPEVSIMEVQGDEPNTIHMDLNYATQDGSLATSAGQWNMPEDPSSDWHTYAVDWKPDQVAWYIDGIERRVVTDRAQIPTSPMVLALTLAVRGAWAGNPGNSTDFPGAFEIDYVRVWKRGAEQMISPMADTYVDPTQSTVNFGTEHNLIVDADPQRTAYLKFDLRPFAGKKLQSAWLRVKTSSDPYSGSQNSQILHLVPQGGWSEERMTAQNAPPFTQESIGLLAETQPNLIYDIPLDSTVVQDHLGEIFSIAITTNGSDGLSIFSREALSLGPRLFINTQ